MNDSQKNNLLVKLNSLYITAKAKKDSSNKDELIDFILDELKNIINEFKKVN